MHPSAASSRSSALSPAERGISRDQPALLSQSTSAFAARQIRRPAGANAGLRDDAAGLSAPEHAYFAPGEFTLESVPFEMVNVVEVVSVAPNSSTTVTVAV